MKGLIKNYTFNTAARTITLTDIATVRLDKLALITDTTTNKILYNFADSTVATATVATNVITLSVLQGGENNADKLRIDYDVESSDTSAFADTITPVSASSLPLPTGAATSAKQDAQTALLTTIDADTGTIATEVAGLLTDTELRATPVPVSGTVTATPTGTQNVDVTANTIGLSTSANQTNGTQQTKLTDGTNTVAVGSLGDGDGSRQSLVVDGRMRMYNGTSFDRIRGNTTDGLLVNLGANNDVTVTSGAITETNSAAIKAAVETIDNAISGNEMQVDIVAPLPAGTNNIGDVDVLSLPALAAGTNAIGKLSANSGVDIGDVDVTSTVLPVGAATSSVTSEADSSSSVTLKSSNSARKEIIIQNTSSAILYVKYGTTATTSDFTVLLSQNDILIEDRYTGRIDGIWATDPGNGAAKVTEIT